MKKLLLILSLFSFSCLGGGKYNVILDGGLTKFKGNIVAGACRTNTSSYSQYVDMGSVSSNQFKNIGDYSNDVGFFIKLDDCNEKIASSVSILFKGEINNHYYNSLSVGHGSDMAKGVGVVIFDSTNNPLELNTLFNPKYNISDGNIVFQFIAKYVKIEDRVIGGKVNSVLNFDIVYQ